MKVVEFVCDAMSACVSLTTTWAKWHQCRCLTRLKRNSSFYFLLDPDIRMSKCSSEKKDEVGSEMGETREEVVKSKKAPEKACAETKSQKRRIYKNVLLVSISFLLLFVAFESMSKLQSSINTVDNLGLWSSVVIYASLIISCLFVPSWVISKLTLKWTMVASILCYSTYIAAQFYPQVKASFFSTVPLIH